MVERVYIQDLADPLVLVYGYSGEATGDKVGGEFGAMVVEERVVSREEYFAEEVDWWGLIVGFVGGGWFEGVFGFHSVI